MNSQTIQQQQKKLQTTENNKILTRGWIQINSYDEKESILKPHRCDH